MFASQRGHEEIVELCTAKGRPGSTVPIAVVASCGKVHLHPATGADTGSRDMGRTKSMYGDKHITSRRAIFSDRHSGGYRRTRCFASVQLRWQVSFKLSDNRSLTGMLDATRVKIPGEDEWKVRAHGTRNFFTT